MNEDNVPSRPKYDSFSRVNSSVGAIDTWTTISGAEKPVADIAGHTGRGGTWRVQFARAVSSSGGPNDAVC